MHTLCALLSIRAPDATTAAAATNTATATATATVTSALYRSISLSTTTASLENRGREGDCVRLQGAGEGNVLPDLTVFSKLAPLLPSYIRTLPLVLTPAPVPVRNMVHLLSSSWNARTYKSFRISVESDPRSALSTPGSSGDVARDVIVAWAIALSLPSASVPPSVPMSASTSLSEEEIEKIVTYFQSFDKLLQSSIPLDRYCCYTLGRISGIIVRSLQAFICTASIGRQGARGEGTRIVGQGEGLGQGLSLGEGLIDGQGQEQVVASGSARVPVTHSHPLHPLCHTLLGPKGDDCWGRLSSQLFVRLAVTVHTYAMRR